MHTAATHYDKKIFRFVASDVCYRCRREKNPFIFASARIFTSVEVLFLPFRRDRLDVNLVCFMPLIAAKTQREK